MANENILYLSEKQLKSVTSISNNVAIEEVLPHFETAQVAHIDPFLKATLSANIKAAILSKIFISASTQTNPVSITTDGYHGYSTGDIVYINESQSATGINGQKTITVVNSTTFTLDGIDGTGFPVFVSGTAFVMKMTEAIYNLMNHDSFVAAVGNYGFYEAIPFIWAKFMDKSVLIRGGGDHDKAVSKSDIVWFRSNVMNAGAIHLEGIKKYLLDYPDDYPDFVKECGSGSKPNSFNSRIRF